MLNFNTKMMKENVTPSKSVCEDKGYECYSSIHCMNAATCTDAVYSYTCGCVVGYTGKHCETGSSTTSITYPCGYPGLIKNIVFDRTICVTSFTISDATWHQYYLDVEKKCKVSYI